MPAEIDRPSRRLIAMILLIAAALRLPLAFVEMFHHPDEIWQYLEPAYGMVTGHRVITWEYREGMRSWLIPTLLAGPMWIGKLAPATKLYMILPRLLAVALSLAIVGFGTAIALRISRTHAIVTGLVLATAFELVYFSARTLSDSIAVDFFLPAAWLLLPGSVEDRRRWLLGGLLLGICVAVRFQLAPAIAVFALLCCGTRPQKWLWVIAAGVAGLAFDGLVDMLHGLTPFAWMANNFRLNLIEGKAAAFSTKPAWWFVVEQVRVWGVAAAPMLLLAALGGRRHPILFVTALANIAVHSLIPHKEYRFIWLSSVLLILLAGIGTADVLLWAFGRWRARTFIGGVGVLFWIDCSASTALSPGGKEQWKGGARSIALMRAEHDQPGACGLVYYDPNEDARVAYYYVDRPIPILFLDQPSRREDLARYGSTFNLIAAAPDRATELGPAYTQTMCKYGAKLPGDAKPSDQVCLYTRAGGCSGEIPSRLDVNEGFARQKR